VSFFSTSAPRLSRTLNSRRPVHFTHTSCQIRAMGTPFSLCCRSDAADLPDSDILPKPRSTSQSEPIQTSSKKLVSKDDLPQQDKEDNQFIKELKQGLPETNFSQDLSWIHPASIETKVEVPIAGCVHPAAYQLPKSHSAPTLPTPTSFLLTPTPAAIVNSPVSAAVSTTGPTSPRSSDSSDSPKLRRVLSGSSVASRSSQGMCAIFFACFFFWLEATSQRIRLFDCQKKVLLTADR